MCKIIRMISPITDDITLRFCLQGIEYKRRLCQPPGRVLQWGGSPYFTALRNVAGRNQSRPST